MNEVAVKINPYNMVNEFTINGKGISPYSELNNFVKRPFLSWAYALFPALEQEINDRFTMTVTGEEFETRFLEDMSASAPGCCGFRKGDFRLDMFYEDRIDEFAKLCSRYGRPVSPRRTDTELCLAPGVDIRELEQLVSRYRVMQSFQGGFVMPGTLSEIRATFRTAGSGGSTGKDTVYLAGSMQEARAVRTDRTFGSGEAMVMVLSDHPEVLWQNHCYYWGIRKSQLCHGLELLYAAQYVIPDLVDEIRSQNLEAGSMKDEDGRMYAMLSRTDAILTAEELPVLEKGQGCRIRVSTIPPGEPLPEIQVRIDNPAVARSSGLNLEALAGGVTRVHLFSLGNAIPFASLALTVEEHNYAVSLKIQAPGPWLGEGCQTQLSLKAQPVDAEDLGSCRWSSSDTKVAAVDARGMVKGTGGGTVRITVKGARTEDSVTLQVKPRIQRIAISRRDVNLYVGDRCMVGVETYPQDCYDNSWQWTSTDAGVAVLSLEKGYPEIVAKGVGQCIVTVRADGGAILDSCSVKVESTFYRKENKHTALSASLVLTLTALAATAVWAPAAAVFSVLSAVLAVRAVKKNRKDMGYGILFLLISLFLLGNAVLTLMGGL